MNIAPAFVTIEQDPGCIIVAIVGFEILGQLEARCDGRFTVRLGVCAPVVRALSLN